MSDRRFRRTCGVAGLAFTEQQYLLGIQGAAMRGGETVTHLTNSQGIQQDHVNAARHVARATELVTVATNSCGSCVRNLVLVTLLTYVILTQ